MVPGPAWDQGLAPLTPPQALPCVPRWRTRGRKNKQGRSGGLGWELAGGWKEVRNVARTANKALSGAPSPRGDPGPVTLSRGAPDPRLGAGLGARRAHARAPGLRRPSPGSPCASQAEPEARPEGAKDRRLAWLLNLTPAAKPKERGRGGDSMLMSLARKRGDAGAR